MTTVSIVPSAQLPPRPLIEITWVDDGTGVEGYVVIDSTVDGAASGGLRMDPSVTLEQVRALARTMSLKELVAWHPEDPFVPFGGAKGGIAISPQHPQALAVLERFLTAMKPVITSTWALGEDLGTRQEDIDRALARVAVSSCIEAAFRRMGAARPAGAERMSSALASMGDGGRVRDLVGGYGVARATLTAWRAFGAQDDPAVALQGFGVIGGATARYLAQAGVRVVAVADRQGAVRNDRGLDVATMLDKRQPGGLINRAELPRGVEHLTAADFFSAPADIHVLAAGSSALEAKHASILNSRLVVEGANLAVTEPAARRLRERRITVLPDFVANFATNSWWWWSLFGCIEATERAAFTKVDEVMTPLVMEVIRAAEVDGVRSAALSIVERRLSQLATRADFRAAALKDETVAGNSFLEPAQEQTHTKEKKMRMDSPEQVGTLALAEIREVLNSVVAEKATGNLAEDVRLRDDLALDSVDLMEVLIAIRERALPAEIESCRSEESTNALVAVLEQRSRGEELTIGSLRSLYERLVAMR